MEILVAYADRSVHPLAVDDGVETVRMCHMYPVDVLFAGGVLKRLDGKAVLAALRRDPPRKMPVIVGLGDPAPECGIRIPAPVTREKIEQAAQGLSVAPMARLRPDCARHIPALLDSLGIPCTIAGRRYAETALEILLRDPDAAVNGETAKVLGISAEKAGQGIRSLMEHCRLWCGNSAREFLGTLAERLRNGDFC